MSDLIIKPGRLTGGDPLLEFTGSAGGSSKLAIGAQGAMTFTLDETGQAFTFEGGPLVVAQGLTGSLTKLDDGSDYLRAGAGISLTTESNGAVTIASTVAPAATSNGVQFNDGGTFGGDSTFTFNKGTDTLSVQNVVVAGDLTVNGTFVTVNTTNLEVNDSVVGLGFASGTIAAPVGDRGLIMGLSNEDNVALLWKEAQDEFALGRTASSATGSLPVALSSYANLRVANIQGAIITASLGFSGSLTKLVDGSDYLRAGANITLTTGGLGQVTISATGGVAPTAQFLTLASDASLDNERVFTAGTGLVATDGGAGGNFTVGINNGVVATISGSTFTGAVKFNLGLSGSLTKLADGSDYLLAGANITLTTESNGAVSIAATVPASAPVGASYLTLGTNATLTDERVLTMGTGLVSTDSGVGGNFTVGINDGVVATISGSTFTGAVKFNEGLSGSLTTLTDGTSYLRAGAGITVTSESNGAVTITSAVSPGSPETGIQFNSGGAFAASANFTFASNTVFLTGSLANGDGSIASGQNSHAEGAGTTAQGAYSHAEGDGTIALGNYSHAEGKDSLAQGSWAHAEGYYTTASNSNAHSEGGFTTAAGQYSHAEGYGTLAGAEFTGNSSHAEGYFTTASGFAAHAEGWYTLASGQASHTEGTLTTASANYSHAAGVGTIAAGVGQNVVGRWNKTGNTDSLFIVGDGTANNDRNDIFLVNPDNVMIGSASLGTDTFLYVGTQGARNTATFAGNTYVSGTGRFAVGLSGSLTKLVDGSDYLRAGANVTLTTESNGSVTIAATVPSSAPVGASYLTLGYDGTLTNERQLTMGTGLLSTDGGANGAYTIGINDGVVATISGSTFTGVVKFNEGLSGSLTKLVDGTSYIRAGAAITVTTGSGGWIEIASTATTNAGGSTTQVQFNDSNAFAGDSTFTFNKDTDTLNVQNVIVAGDLTVNGTFVTVNSTNLEVSDSVIGLGFASGTLAAPAGDRGLIMGLQNEDNVALLWKEVADEFALGRTSTSSTGSLPISLNSYSNLHVANLQASIITASLGFSGSLTKLVDGSDYLRAGANITLTTESNGAVTIAATVPSSAPVGASYLTLGYDGTLTNERLLTMGTGLLSNDGGANGAYTLSVNNSVVATISGSTFTGAVKFNAGLSGSLTKLADDSDYLKAGANIALTTESNGSVTIATTGLAPAGASYLTLGLNGALTNERVFTMGTGLVSTDGGLGGNYTVGINNSVVATISGSTFTGAVKFNEGLSGSLTKLVDGSDYLKAGANVTLTTESNGSVTIAATVPTSAPVGASYLTLGYDGTLTNERLLTMGTGLLSTDGGANGAYTLSVNNGVVATISGSTFTGAVKFNEGLSGSLTQLVDGTSYIRAGAAITVTTGSGGWIEIASTATTNAGGSTTQVQFNDNNSFAGDSTFTFNKDTDTLSVKNAVVAGDLIVNGLFVTVNTTNLEVSDSVVGLGFASGTIAAPVGDRGLIMGLSGEDNVALLWKETADEFALGRTASSATGSLPVALTSYSNLQVAKLQASIITASLGFSGSLTKLVDGSDYLKAGANITLTTESNGSVTIAATVPSSAPVGASYLTLGYDGTLTNERLLTMGTGLVSTDGGANGAFTLSVNDGVVATISGSTFTGAVKFNAGLSGSLTKLVDGTSYLRAGAGITVTSESNGAVTITSTATATPGSPDTGIQYNNGGAFAASSAFTFAGGTVFLTGSLANGNGSIATGLYAHAEGNSTTAFGQNSHAEGNNAKTGATNYDGTWSGGNSAHAEGEDTIAYGDISHAEGYDTKTGASGSAGWSGGVYAHAEGVSTTAFGEASHTEGLQTKTGVMGAGDVWSGGDGAHAEGVSTTAFGQGSHAEGNGTKTGASGSSGWSGGDYAHAEGYNTTAFGQASHTEGYLTKTGVMGADDVWGGGGYAHAEGQNTTAFGQGSHAEGFETKTGASGSAGWSGGLYAHAEGGSTTAFGERSHAEGYNTKTGVMGADDVWTGGEDAHAEGENTTAFGGASHTEGAYTQTGASGSAGWLGGDYAHAEGNGTIAFGAGSHAEGYDTQTGIMGADDVWSGGQYAHAEGRETVAIGEASHAEGYMSTGSGGFAHAEGRFSLASGLFSHAEGDLTTAGGVGSHAEGSGSLAMGVAAHAEGFLTSAPANYSHAEGWVTIASGSWSHAEGKATTTSGSWSHAEGVFTVARGEASHAEGSGSLATGIGSHAEGKDTTALGNFSHAGGVATLASGYGSTTMGLGSVAAGNYAFASGEYVVASGSAQTVFGKYNKLNNSGSLLVVGNGSEGGGRRDIFIVNEGHVMIGSGSVNSDTFFYVGSQGAANVSLFDGDLTVSGSLKASSKSFVIDHPSKPGWKLQYGSLEGPEHGIYARGRSSSTEIVLPEYWTNLVFPDSVTVQITPIGGMQSFYVTSVSPERITLHVEGEVVDFFYFVQAQRRDVTFDVEYQKV
jgi:hypothetical protein